MQATDVTPSRDSARTPSKLRYMLKDLMLLQLMLKSSPEASDYLKECSEKDDELQEISENVEVGLCTCTWLNS